MTNPVLETDVYSVSALNQAVRNLIENQFLSIWVEGEISNLARPASGHLYFSLKDESAQVRCAMFRMNNRLLKFHPENGLQVRVRANASLYEARGDYQLIVEKMEEAGDGALRRKFEQLKTRLAEEGLFDDAHKQYLPDFPSRIGVITSPTGAAIKDILHVLKRRFPSLPVLIYPIPVQGNDAPPKIVHMIQKANARADCDVLIIARGGGSLEDLWAFNDEQVARALYACDIPVVCGVGHETDFTIADFVADVRAPTPSAAAELVSPDRENLLATILTIKNRLMHSATRKLQLHGQQLDWLSKRIQHPSQRLRQYGQRLEDLVLRIRQVQKMRLQQAQTQAQALGSRLQGQNPAQRVREWQLRVNLHHQRLRQRMENLIESRKQTVGSLARELDAVSPLATLNRGYAIVTGVDDETIIKSANQIKTGQQIKTRLHKGVIFSTIDSVE